MRNEERRKRFAYKNGPGATPAELDMRYGFLTARGTPAVGRKGRAFRPTPGDPGDDIVHFTTAPLHPQRATNDKQIRKRARRRGELLEADLNLLYKPVEEWDDEELARGRPRDAAGRFSGKQPTWISKAYHEEIIRRYEKLVKTEMNVHTIEALAVMSNILQNNAVDKKGKPMVPAAVKLDAAKFLIEHVIGKPVKRIENEVSVTLQGILAHAMVNPSQTNFDEYQLTQGYIDADVVDDTMGRKNDGN
jgi:hypothetical protein